MTKAKVRSREMRVAALYGRALDRYFRREAAYRAGGAPDGTGYFLLRSEWGRLTRQARDLAARLEADMFGYEEAVA